MHGPHDRVDFPDGPLDEAQQGQAAEQREPEEPGGSIDGIVAGLDHPVLQRLEEGCAQLAHEQRKAAEGWQVPVAHRPIRQGDGGGEEEPAQDDDAQRINDEWHDGRLSGRPAP